jgi:hypothetical protein
MSSAGFDDEIIHLVQKFWTSHTDFLYDEVNIFQNFWNSSKVAGGWKYAASSNSGRFHDHRL